MKAPTATAPKSFLDQYDALDRTLVKAGFPATSAWWRKELGRLFGEGTAPTKRRWIIRAGRRAGKSSTLARLAVAWALFGDHSVPLGDIGVVSFLSLSRDEASSRLRTIAQILTTLGIKHEVRGEEIEISIKRPVLFKVYAASIRAVGHTSILILCDEVARWESREEAANPAKAIIGSIAPTMATVPAAFMVLSSSPWSTDDEHALAFDRGDDATQQVSFGTTWDCNPTISEAYTHELEPDERDWRREYAAEPGNTVNAVFEADDITAAFSLRSTTGGRADRFMAIDPSSLRPGGDGFGWICGHTRTSGEIVIDEVDEWSSSRLKDEGQRKELIKHLAQRARRHGVTKIWSDQHESSGLESDFQDRGLKLIILPWTTPSKAAAFQVLRSWLRDRRLHLPQSTKLLREFNSVKLKLSPSGTISYTTNGLDLLSPIVTLATAACVGEFDPGNSKLAAWNRAMDHSDAADRRLGIGTEDVYLDDPWRGGLVDPSHLFRW